MAALEPGSNREAALRDFIPHMCLVTNIPTPLCEILKRVKWPNEGAPHHLLMSCIQTSRSIQLLQHAINWSDSTSKSNTLSGAPNSSSDSDSSVPVKELLRSSKFILTTREPGDYAWAAWNFWTNELDTDRHAPGYWTQPNNYRSPQLFDELLRSQGAIHDEFLPRATPSTFCSTLDSMQELRSLAGKNNTLFLQSDNLSNPATYFQIANFSGLSLGYFKLSAPWKKRVNAGYSFAQRGGGKTDNSKETGVYEVSGYRPMLPSSRELIYNSTGAYCCVMQRDFGIAFERCLKSNAEHGRLCETNMHCNATLSA